VKKRGTLLDRERGLRLQGGDALWEKRFAGEEKRGELFFFAVSDKGKGRPRQHHSKTFRLGRRSGNSLLKGEGETVSQGENTWGVENPCKSGTLKKVLGVPVRKNPRRGGELCPSTEGLNSQRETEKPVWWGVPD